MSPNEEKTPPEVKPVVAKPVSPKENPQTGRKNINWIEAYKYYCTKKPDGTQMTYREVSEKFKVSETRVQEVGSEKSWVKNREELVKRGLEEFEKARINEITATEKRHLKTWRGIQQTALELLRDLRGEISGDNKDTILRGNATATTELKNITAVLDIGISGERLALGLPTTIGKSDITSKGEAIGLTPEMAKEMDDIMEKNEKDTDITE